MTSALEEKVSRSAHVLTKSLKPAEKMLPFGPVLGKEFWVEIPPNPEAARKLKEYLEQSKAEEEETRAFGKKLNDEGNLDMDHFILTGEIREPEDEKSSSDSCGTPKFDENKAPSPAKKDVEKFYPVHPLRPGMIARVPQRILTRNDRLYVTSSSRRRPPLPPDPVPPKGQIQPQDDPSRILTPEECREDLTRKNDARKAEKKRRRAAAEKKREELLYSRKTWKKYDKVNWYWPMWETQKPLRRTQIYLRSRVRPGTRKLTQAEREEKYQKFHHLGHRICNSSSDSEIEVEKKQENKKKLGQ